MLRRTFLAGALLQQRGDSPLIRDARFAQGLRVLEPAPGKKVEAGIIAPPGASGAPVWQAAQWHSRFNLAGKAREPLASGGVRYFDGAKAVIFAPAGADLTLALDGKAEYGDTAPAPGAAWPHLLVEQEIVSHPRITEVSALPFHIEYKLLRSQPHRLPGWNEQRHTAQFLLYITIQNQNRASVGYGDYLWFGVPMFDARYRLPRRHAAKDMTTPHKQGTGKFIFNPGGEHYNPHPVRTGEWNTIDRDLLPLMREAMEAAWKAGFLSSSRDAADYRLGGLNLGWEVTGPLDVAIDVRRLGLWSRG